MIRMTSSAVLTGSINTVMFSMSSVIFTRTMAVPACSKSSLNMLTAVLND